LLSVSNYLSKLTTITSAGQQPEDVNKLFATSTRKPQWIPNRCFI